jgi:SOS response regulatory protein OraA/RecX
MHAAEEKGCMASREEIARNMTAKGYELEEIQAITGLTDEEARKLR